MGPLVGGIILVAMAFSGMALHDYLEKHVPDRSARSIIEGLIVLPFVTLYFVLIWAFGPAE